MLIRHDPRGRVDSGQLADGAVEPRHLFGNCTCFDARGYNSLTQIRVGTLDATCLNQDDWSGCLTVAGEANLCASTNFILPTSPPCSPVVGSFYFCACEGSLYVYDGSYWDVFYWDSQG